MAKFDPSRVTGGTIELVRNDDGSYTSQVTGFNQIATLNLPDITTTATTSTATTDAAEEAKETLEEQTSTAFKMPSIMAKGEQSDTADFGTTMTQEAAQTSKLLTDTFEDPIQIKSPEAPLYDDFPENKNVVDTGSPISNILNEAKVKEDDTTITLSKARIRGPRDLGTTQTTTTRVPQGFDPLRVMSPREERDQRFTDDAGLPEAPAYDYPDLGPALGITTDTQPSATREAKEKDFASGTLGISTREAKERDFASGTIEPVKQSALRTLSQTVKRNIKNIQIPSIALTVMRAVAGPETSVQAHAKKYFNVRDDGRIAGNPATDLYAGFNRTSAFGNLEKAGERRIETREKTIEKKGYGPGDKFYDDTQRMKDQQDDYTSSNAAAKSRDSAVAQEAANRDAARGGGSDSGGGGGKIVCTMMNETYGFGSFRNKIWLRQSKDLAPEYQKGYHKIFLPLVRLSKTNIVIRKILEHIAVHRTIDIRQETRGKTHILGRVYRKVLEPICYLVGKLWQ